MPAKYGIVTPKDFIKLSDPAPTETMPTGVWDWERIELRHILPQLGAIPLALYYHLRIACCAHMIVTGANKLQRCDRCRNNCGFVCPYCLGVGWLDTFALDLPSGNNMTRCTHCKNITLDERGKEVGVYDPIKELQACRAWLVNRFPFGVPGLPTATDLALMDSVAVLSTRWAA